MPIQFRAACITDYIKNRDYVNVGLATINVFHEDKGDTDMTLIVKTNTQPGQEILLKCQF